MTDLLNKYRPKTWDEVYGNGEAVKALQSAIEKKAGRAYLLAGPSGVGKTTLARIAARELGGKDVEVVDIDAASNTGIEAMREVCSTLQYRPLGSTAKAVICDEAHALSKAAVTSLLKPLEEPPPWVYWFLCTTEPAKIPQAVQTRCIPIHLKSLSDKRLVKLLQYIVEQEKSTLVDEGVLWLCAEEAYGSARQAIANLVLCWECKDEESAADLLRTATQSPEAFTLAQALYSGKSWKSVVGILGELENANTNPESIRHIVRAYGVKKALGSSSFPESTLAVLDAFSQPFNTQDGIAPVVLACGRLMEGER